jgi:hypothetical protein
VNFVCPSLQINTCPSQKKSAKRNKTERRFFISMFKLSKCIKFVQKDNYPGQLNDDSVLFSFRKFLTLPVPGADKTMMRQSRYLPIEC